VPECDRFEHVVLPLGQEKPHVREILVVVVQELLFYAVLDKCNFCAGFLDVVGY
jgi:hypothetical protein